MPFCTQPLAGAAVRVREITVEEPPRRRGDPVELCSAWGCRRLWSKGIDNTVPLCSYHFAVAHAAWENALEVAGPEVPKPPHERIVGIPTHNRPRPVVYYVSMQANIKIGTTRSFERRMREFYVQRCDVLAVEPGGRSLEASRHQQFASYRIKGTELFRRNGVLDELVAELAAANPDPWSAAKEINSPHPTFEEVTEEVARSRGFLV